MQDLHWRDYVWFQLNQPWDIIIIGGGITGAGILHEATRLGLRSLLVEQRDFAWGASGRSSKLIHGGLRYMKEGNLRLTLESVRERERLLQERRGLIDPLGFLLPVYKERRSNRWLHGAGLLLYELFALHWPHQYLGPKDFSRLVPYLAHSGLDGGFQLCEGQTDDARLVMRIIRESLARGGMALNYVSAELALCNDGRVKGVRLRDMERSRSCEAVARIVVNATGAWADQLRSQVGASARIRPLRGSHLILPAARLPLTHAIGFMHPIDRRPVFALPWEGVSLVGTTDIDHQQPLDDEPIMQPEEAAYLMTALEAQFPSLNLTLADVISVYAGVRPVIDTGKADSSKESRDYAIWEERGLLTVAGGKLTTFRLSALETLRKVRRHFPEIRSSNYNVSTRQAGPARLPEVERFEVGRFLGRYGEDTQALFTAALPGELQRIPGTQILWGELRWAVRSEGVVHLDDLLLRRVRLGLLLPQGGEALLPAIRAICQSELNWSDARWESEQARYQALWHRYYSLPDKTVIPKWRSMLAQI
jgi:glycerol-3-phosphate dehydrogenase